MVQISSLLLVRHYGLSPTLALPAVISDPSEGVGCLPHFNPNHVLGDQKMAMRPP